MLKFIYSAFIFLMTLTVSAQDFSKVEIKTHQVTENIYMLEGKGGNVGVFAGEDGVLMIDSQFAPLSDKIKAAINKISPKSIKYLVNTHWHGDHTGGNENFGVDKAIIVAHENVFQRLSTDQFMKAFSREVKAKPKAAWPTITFEKDVKVHINGEAAVIMHVHNAHTDGDSFVWFPDSNVLHMGDCFFKDRFPFIDLGSEGSVKGAIKAVELALMLTDNDTKIIPGHGSLANKFDLLNYFTMLKQSEKAVTKMIKEGKSVEEIKKANLGDEWATWGGGFISKEKWLDTVWTDLSREEEK